MSLENDMSAIRTEHFNQLRTAQSQRTKLDMIIGDLSELRLMGKQDVGFGSSSSMEPVEGDDQDSRGNTLEPSTGVGLGLSLGGEGLGGREEEDGDVEMGDEGREESGELKEDGEEDSKVEEGLFEGDDDGRVENPEDGEEAEEGEEDESDVPLSKTIHSRRSFLSHSQSQSRTSTPLPPLLSHSSARQVKEEGEEEEDIEMGELAEDPPSQEVRFSIGGAGGGGGGSGGGQGKLKKMKEDLEEGEASDLSSELSELPDE